MQSMHASQEEALTAFEDDGANVYIYSVCVDEVRWRCIHAGLWIWPRANRRVGLVLVLCFSPADVSGTRVSRQRYRRKGIASAMLRDYIAHVRRGMHGVVRVSAFALDLLRDRELNSKWILAHQRRISLVAHKEIAYSLYQSVSTP